MRKIRVGVLRGGPSSEYEVSLKTGEAVIKNMPDIYEPVDIFVSQEGVWHLSGAEHKPHEVLKKVDVVFNAMHGQYGEDGEAQEFLDKLGVPYTGSKAFASRVAMNKALTKDFVIKDGIKTPIYKVVKKTDFSPSTASVLYQSFPQPSVVKPLAAGSSVGVSIAKNVYELAHALEKAFEVSDSALVEEFISGKEATCGVVEDFKGEIFRTLPPVEILAKSSAGFFDYDAKYKGFSEEICPGRFSQEEVSKLKILAALVHKTLGLRHYSRSDFIIHPKRGIYFLEVNTLPGLTEASLLPKALKADGSSLPEFIGHIVKRALNKHHRT